MQVAIRYGLETAEFEVSNDRLVKSLPDTPTPLRDPVSAIRDALENPFQYPPLRQALTPDDRVAVVVDETLPGIGQLLVPVLEHITSASVKPEAITIVLPTATSQEWIEELPDELQEVKLEIHDPKDRKRLSYLATTKAGRRIYLNRSVGEADQVVVIGRRKFDGWHGFGGAGGDLFPVLSDEPTRDELAKKWNQSLPGKGSWPVYQETEEVLWLMGAPYFIQVLDGPCDTVSEVIAGTAIAREEGETRLKTLWQREISRPANLVIASISGDPDSVTFGDFVTAISNASRVVETDGRIILLTEAKPTLGTSLDVIRHANTPEEALAKLQKQPVDEDTIPALQWARAAEHSRISILSRFENETTEELFAASISDLDVVQQWIEHSESVLFLEDAHRILAVLGKISPEKSND